jgi:hypothetical protein
MAASNFAREPTLGPDGNPSPTPPGYTPPHRPQPNNTSTPSCPGLDPHLGILHSGNLKNIPPYNQATTLATTPFIPTFLPPYNMPFFPPYYPYPQPTMYQQQPFIFQYPYATPFPLPSVTPLGATRLELPRGINLGDKHVLKLVLIFLSPSYSPLGATDPGSPQLHPHSHGWAYGCRPTTLLRRATSPRAVCIHLPPTFRPSERRDL